MRTRNRADAVGGGGMGNQYFVRAWDHGADHSAIANSSALFFHATCLCARCSVCLFLPTPSSKADRHSRATLEETREGIWVTFQPRQQAAMYVWTNYLSSLSFTDSSVKRGKKRPPQGRIRPDGGCEVMSNVLDLIALTGCHHGYELYAVTP